MTETVWPVMGAGGIWLALGIVFGVLSALNQGKVVEGILTVLAMAGISTPIFWLGAVLLYLLTFVWHGFFLFTWIPSGGYVGLTASPLQWAEHLVLPWICLSVVSM